MSLDDLKPFIDWLQANPTWAGVATFVLSIMESLAVVGMLIPGTLVMGAIGSLIGSGVLPAFSITAWAAAGAVVGDGISYWLGHHYHERIRYMWPFKSFPVLMLKGEQFFLKHGGKSVFMGRFIGPIRPIIPVIAGMMNMPPNRFTIANIGSAIAWAPIYMLPGYLIGSLSVQLAPHTATRFLVIAIILLLGLWCAYWIIKKLYTLLKRMINRLLLQLWKIISVRPKFEPLKELLQDAKTTANKQHQLGAALMLIITLTGFFFITFHLNSHHPELNPWNYFMLHMGQSLRYAELDVIAIALTLAFKTPVLLVIALVVLLPLLQRRAFRAALHWLFNIVLATASTILLHLTMQTPLPSIAIALNDYAYPSLSLTLMTAILTLLALFITRQIKRQYHFTCYLLISLIIGCVALAKLYLGQNWLLSVVGSILLGVSCAIICSISYRRQKTLALSNSPLLLAAFLALIVSAAWTLISYSQIAQQYRQKEQQPYLVTAHSWWDPLSLPVPYYRQTLWGKPAELMNIQWAGDLEKISSDLKQQGWQKAPKPNLAVILNRIAAKEREQQLPLLPYLYLDHKPNLIMTKTVGKQKTLLVLRLWNANLVWQNKKHPIWLGTLSYRHIWQAPFIKNKLPLKSISNIAPDQVMTADLKDYTWKKTQVINKTNVKLKSDNDILLLIRPDK